MKKQFAITLAFAVASFLLGVMPVAAQGRGRGMGHGPSGAPGAGAAGMHEPMGMGSAMNGHSDANFPNTPAPKGPKTPDQLLAQNSKLSTNLAALLPSGTDLQTAAQGFKNLGQFVATVHVSHNLGISFDCLKADMTDTAPPTTATCPAGTGTGSKSLSLGKSIHTLKPDMSKSDVKSALKTANHQTHTDMKS